MRNLHNEPDVVLEAVGTRGAPWQSMEAA
jgi:hypothetical protein